MMHVCCRDWRTLCCAARRFVCMLGLAIPADGGAFDLQSSLVGLVVDATKHSSVLRMLQVVGDAECSVVS